ncbi:NUDIX domain-containing protein [Candidatus Uhrbacteria bacterium]|jgi:ADP-ribose pyrophosphatase YjhB (NUDIX family)|nr:NUDIX domain-containing protein [Candidatus Uhrbacteria bacterium]MBT7717592.1 NUDIX domain-containing protein [Candidatus Uhrbacteria bacterium]
MKQDSRHNSTRRSVSSRQPGSSDKHRVEVSSGGLVFKRAPEGVVFAMQMDSYGKWTFAKGHVRKGESYRKTAVREIEEELGLKGLRYIKPLGHIDIWFRDRFVFKGKLVRKFIHYFLFEAPADAKLTPLQDTGKGEIIQDAAWIRADQVWDKSSYEDMKPVVRRALQYFEKPRRVRRRMGYKRG